MANIFLFSFRMLVSFLDNGAFLTLLGLEKYRSDQSKTIFFLDNVLVILAVRI